MLYGFNIWQFLGGIALFVYAMSLMEESLKQIGSRKLKKFLQKQSGKPLRMMAASTVVTALLQSSSVVILMVLSFTGAGLMNMRGALASSLGANLGTTLDSWIIALIGFKINFEALSFPLLALGLGITLFLKKQRRMYPLIPLLSGLAFLFISLEWMKNSVDKDSLNDVLNLSGIPPLGFIPVGFVITAVIQSSSAAMAITLSALYNHLIPFEAAAAVVIGSELGTTIKFLIGSANSSADKRRVAWGNFSMNLATVIIASIALYPLAYLSHDLLSPGNDLTALVIFQSGINLSSIILFLPFLGAFGNYLEARIKEKDSGRLSQFIYRKTAVLVSDSLELASCEIAHLTEKCVSYNKSMMRVATPETETDYDQLKKLQGEILAYLASIPPQSMNQEETALHGKLLTGVRHLLRSVKNIKDIRHNLEEMNHTASDRLYHLGESIRNSALQFYQEFSGITNPALPDAAMKAAALETHNREWYETDIARIMAALSEQKIEEKDAVMLLNVYREIYSSNKALIRTAEDLRNLGD
ncbi:MAG: Na/Pi cotransporter family protein [Bacteroidia bacterium]|nr:Na/Pi cotransporter family protein [Bacteroidia bacterium]